MLKYAMFLKFPRQSIGFSFSFENTVAPCQVYITYLLCNNIEKKQVKY